MINAYIFDLDDTLIPSDERTARAYARLAAAGADQAKVATAGTALWHEVAEDKAEHDAEAAVKAGLQGVWLDRRNSATTVPAGVRRITSLAEL
jgi:FMN phosphatase YigB (HAD superfamily)